MINETGGNWYSEYTTKGTKNTKEGEHECRDEAQLLTYLKLARIPTGLLINFNVLLLKDGLKRFVV